VSSSVPRSLDLERRLDESVLHTIDILNLIEYIENKNALTCSVTMPNAKSPDG
jgi:hypothetical protein